MTELDFPEHLTENTKDIIARLLHKDPKSRIGSESLEELMNHPFFYGINFHEVRQTEVPFTCLARASRIQ